MNPAGRSRSGSKPAGAWFICGPAPAVGTVIGWFGERDSRSFVARKWAASNTLCGQVIGRNGRGLKGPGRRQRANLPAMSGSREAILARIGPAGASDLPLLQRIAAMALAAIHREYPSHVSHLLRSDADARPPRELTPAFYGSFDWHSAVHGHWCLARLARLHPAEVF